MGVALEEARLAPVHDDVPVGAVVVRLADGVAVARRHNERQLTGDPTGHAEVLALRDAAAEVGSWRLDGHALVVSLEPCPMCAGAMWAARIPIVVFGAADSRAGASGTLSVAKVLTTPHNPSEAVATGVRRLLEQKGIGPKDLSYAVAGATTLVTNTLLEGKGDVDVIYAVARDVTERVRLEAELERSRRDIDDFMENANVPLHRVDARGIVVWANRAELEFLGYPREEYVGQPIAKFHADQAVIADILTRLGSGQCLAGYQIGRAHV